MKTRPQMHALHMHSPHMQLRWREEHLPPPANAPFPALPEFVVIQISQILVLAQPAFVERQLDPVLSGVPRRVRQGWWRRSR